jgi:hypothetical protein
MFCVVIVLSVHVLYGNSAELHLFYGDCADRTCIVW